MAGLRSTMLFMGKSTISMVIFHSYVTNYQRVLAGSGRTQKRKNSIPKLGQMWSVMKLNLAKAANFLGSK